jgi:hypothetical protein
MDGRDSTVQVASVQMRFTWFHLQPMKRIEPAPASHPARLSSFHNLSKTEECACRSGADEDIGALGTLGLLGKGENIRYVAVRDLDLRLASIFGNNARDLERQLARTFDQRKVTDQEEDARASRGGGELFHRKNLG